jgi:hypothetical protein
MRCLVREDDQDLGPVDDRTFCRGTVLKTVSAHISSMLRKTGTTSRTELAQKYRRLTATAPAG